jgi:hypothetical protein
VLALLEQLALNRIYIELGWDLHLLLYCVEEFFSQVWLFLKLNFELQRRF